MRGDNLKENIGKSTSLVMISKVVAQVLTLVITMLMSRFLSMEEYGTYSQAILSITMVTSFVLLGLPDSMNYFMGIYEDELQKKNFISVYYTLCTILSLVSGFLLLLGVRWLIRYFNNPLLKSIWFFLLFFPLSRIILSTVENLCIVYHRTNFLFVFRLLHSIFMVATIYVAYIMDMSFKKYMWMLLSVSLFFSSVVCFFANIFSGGLRIKLSSELINRIMVFSLPLGMATAVGTINIELDKLMIGRFTDTTMMAVYTNASKEIPISIVASAFTAILLPKFACYIKNGDNEKVITLWGSAIKISFIIISFFSIGMFVFAPDCLSVLYSDKYIVGADIFRIYCLLLLMRTTYFGIVLNASGHSKLIFYSALAALGLNSILNYLLFSLCGIIGPALATLLSQVLIDWFQIAYSGKIMRIEIKNIFPWSELAKILLVNTLLGFIFGCIKKVIRLEEIMGSEIESIILAFIWCIFDLFIFRKVLVTEWRRLNSLS